MIDIAAKDRKPRLVKNEYSIIVEHLLSEGMFLPELPEDSPFPWSRWWKMSGYEVLVGQQQLRLEKDARSKLKALHMVAQDTTNTKKPEDNDVILGIRPEDQIQGSKRSIVLCCTTCEKEKVMSYHVSSDF